LIGVNANRRARGSTATVDISLPATITSENKEAAVTTVAEIRGSQTEMRCVRCGDSLIAPEWSEYVNKGHIVNLWACPNCGCRFETTANFPADVAAKAAETAVEDFFPSLLVA
jgi:NAD-dependent SIR2 family protein deacetylase